MSIKPDLWIRRKSTPPTHALYVRPGSSDIKELAWEGNTHTVEQLEDLERRFWAVRLKDTDPLVRDFKPMIEPFESGQVRGTEETPLLSYGTSSYGYDVRCADEFKIFTNINSQIIDPKNFNDRIFVDHIGKYCIIPPNSFVLARTMEYFRIPRNVLTICLGKSTYARCFTGDTKVALVNGITISFEDMVKRVEQGERFWGYSTDAKGDIVVAELTAPRKVGHESVLAVTLDNGEVIRCTPDHKFMLRDGSYVEAKDLAPETSLMPLYRGEYRGKVVSVESVEGTHDVYCLTVPEHGNFALESGVFVKNCGIIVNVTPLEPEWEGHVVLEFSNTTNLPAKLYANEGVAQFLFFESDEECETSYKDRGGKYQGQRNITLPRM